METTAATNIPLQVTIPPKENLENKPQGFWSEESPGFADILDALNPLQHIPLVSNLYQEVTGDSASTGSRLAGGALFGGPVGFLASLFNVILEQESGNNLAGHAIAAINGETQSPAPSANEISYTASTIQPFVSASRTSSVNAYVSVQRWVNAAA